VPSVGSQIWATFSGERGARPRRFGLRGGRIGGAVRGGARGARGSFAGSMIPELFTTLSAV